MSKALYILKTKDDDSLEEVLVFPERGSRARQANRRKGTDLNVLA